jgi:hypothetical protein
MSRLPRQAGVRVGGALPQVPPPGQASGPRAQLRASVSLAAPAATATRRPISADALRPPPIPVAAPRPDTGRAVERPPAAAAPEITEIRQVSRAVFDRAQGRAGAAASDPARPQGLSGELFCFLAPSLRDAGILRADRQQAALEQLEKHLAGLNGSVALEAVQVIRGALRSLAQLRDTQNSLIKG